MHSGDSFPGFIIISSTYDYFRSVLTLYFGQGLEHSAGVLY